MLIYASRVGMRQATVVLYRPSDGGTPLTTQGPQDGMVDRRAETRSRPIHLPMRALLLTACALATPLLALLPLRAQLDRAAPGQGHASVRHDAQGRPPEPAHHQAFCFLCVVGLVLLTALPVRLRERSLGVPEPQPRLASFVVGKLFWPQSRSRASPRPARQNSRLYR